MSGLRGKRFLRVLMLALAAAMFCGFTNISEADMRETRLWVVNYAGDDINGDEETITLRYAVEQAQRELDKNHVIRFEPSGGYHKVSPTAAKMNEITLNPAKGYILIDKDVNLTIDGLRWDISYSYYGDAEANGATKIRMDNNASDPKADPRARIFRVQNGNVRFNELILENGDAGGNSSGGAIEVIAWNAKPVITITGCTFRNNRGGVNKNSLDEISEQYGCGGAMYIFNNNINDAYPIVNVVNSAFIENSAPQAGRSGGAVQVARNSRLVGMPMVSFKNCLFKDNTALSKQGYGGGAVTNGEILDGGHVTFDGCTFVGNKAYRAGAVFSSASAITDFVNCTISGNESTGSGNSNIGVIMFCGKGSMANCTVVGNKSARYGAVTVDKDGGNLTLSGNIIVGNVTGHAYHDEATDLSVMSFDTMQLDIDDTYPNWSKIPARLISKGYNLIGNFKDYGPRTIYWQDDIDVIDRNFSKGTLDNNFASFFCWLDIDDAKKDLWDISGNGSVAFDFTRDNHGPLVGAMYDTATAGLKTIALKTGGNNVTPYAYNKIPAANVNLPKTDQRGVKRNLDGGADVGAFEVLSSGKPQLTMDTSGSGNISTTVSTGKSVYLLADGVRGGFIKSPSNFGSVFEDISTYFRWSSSRPDVAVINERGVLFGSGEGTCNDALGTVWAAWGYWNGVSYETSNWQHPTFNNLYITVHPAGGDSISLSGITLKIGEEKYLDPGDAAIVAWTSANDKVACVDVNGKVLALAAGSAQITATNAFGKKESVMVTVENWPAESVTVFTLPEYTEDELIEVEQTFWSPRLIAEVLPDGAKQKVNWSIEDSTIAQFVEQKDLTAQLEGLEQGSTILTAAADGYQTVKRSLGIEVIEQTTVPVLGVTLTPDEMDLACGAEKRIAAVVTPLRAEQSVIWRTSDATVATVADGLVKGVGIGQATITAITVGKTSSNNSMSAECIVSVTQQGALKIYPATSLTLNHAAVELAVDDKVALSADVAPKSADQSIIWESSDESVATITSAGIVTGISEGQTTVIAITSAKDKDDKALVKTCIVTVKKAGDTGSGDPGKASSVVLDRTSARMSIGETLTLVATVFPEAAVNKSVIWSSSVPQVASVNFETGLVTARAGGFAVITATTEDGGHKATCEVTAVAAAQDEGIFSGVTAEELESSGVLAALALVVGAEQSAIKPIDLNQTTGGEDAGNGMLSSFADVALIGGVEQSVPAGGAVVAGGLSFIVRSLSVTGEELPFILDKTGLLANYKIVKYFTAGDTIDLLATYPEAFDYEKGKVVLKGAYVLVDGPAPDGVITVGGMYGVSYRTIGGNPYLFIYDGVRDGRVVDSIALVVKKGAVKNPSGGSGGSGCSSGADCLLLPVFAFAFRRKNRKVK